MIRISKRVVIAFALAWLATSVDAQRLGGDPKAAAVKNPVPATSASIKAGQRAYEQNCRQCHGTKGRGDGTLAPSNPKPADLTDDKWDHGSSDGEIFNVIKRGVPPTMMPSLNGVIPDQDIWNVINYIRSVGPSRQTPASPTPSRAARTGVFTE